MLGHFISGNGTLSVMVTGLSDSRRADLPPASKGHYSLEWVPSSLGRYQSTVYGDLRFDTLALL
jgi:hypothetical protein